jgi:hypothetical protein
MVISQRADAALNPGRRLGRADDKVSLTGRPPEISQPQVPAGRSDQRFSDGSGAGLELREDRMKAASDGGPAAIRARGVLVASTTDSLSQLA